MASLGLTKQRARFPQSLDRTKPAGQDKAIDVYFQRARISQEIEIVVNILSDKGAPIATNTRKPSLRTLQKTHIEQIANNST